MRFQVPQFIEVEDKVFGPLTFKQFLYLGGGAGLSALFYFFLPLLLAIPLIAGAVALSVMLAFYKVNGKPFVFVIQSWFGYMLGSKLYVWKKDVKKPTGTQQSTPEENIVDTLQVPKLSDSKLKDLAWSLDVQEYERNQESANNT